MRPSGWNKALYNPLCGRCGRSSPINGTYRWTRPQKGKSAKISAAEQWVPLLRHTLPSQGRCPGVQLLRKHPSASTPRKRTKTNSLASIRGSSRSLQQCRRNQHLMPSLGCSEHLQDRLHGNQHSQLVVAVVSKLERKCSWVTKLLLRGNRRCRVGNRGAISSKTLPLIAR